jgi:hypothetical protein
LVAGFVVSDAEDPKGLFHARMMACRSGQMGSRPLQDEVGGAQGADSADPDLHVGARIPSLATIS